MKHDKVDVGTKFNHFYIDIVDNYELKNFKDLLSHLDNYSEVS